MRKKLFFVLFISYLILFFFEKNMFLVDGYLKSSLLAYTLFLMPTGQNYYTGPAVVLFLGIDLALDFMPQKFSIIRLSLRPVIRVMLIFLLLIHLCLVAAMIYFVQRGGF